MQNSAKRQNGKNKKNLDFMKKNNTNSLSILFAGSPAIALPSLTAIAEEVKAGRWTLAGIVTNPDKAKGRGAITEATEIGQKAAQLSEEFAALGLKAPAILKYETLKAEARKAVSELKPDLLVTFAFGRIFGPKFMALFPLGGINVHPSLLPKYRGASPIQETILRRDSETGVSIQWITEEVDTGNILAQERIPLNGKETASSLSVIAAEKGAKLLFTVLEQFAETVSSIKKNDPEINCLPKGIPQQGQPSYCSMLEKKSGLIDWNKSALEIDAQIRAYNPWPMAYTNHREQNLNILEAVPYSRSPPEGTLPGGVLGIDKKSGILVQTGDGIIAVSLLQYQYKKVLAWRAFLNGARDFIGSCLGGS